jgi:hypothetical protein
MRLRETLDKLIEKQHELNLTLSRLTDTVEYHVKRSDALEKQVTLIELDLRSDLEKVKEHVNMVNGFAKIAMGLLAVLGGLIGTAVAIYEIFK